jgi:hypothetical protein
MNFDQFNAGISRRLSASSGRRDSYGDGGHQGYQMLGQGSDDEMDPYADDSRASRGRGYDDNYDRWAGRWHKARRYTKHILMSMSAISLKLKDVATCTLSTSPGASHLRGLGVGVTTRTASTMTSATGEAVRKGAMAATKMTSRSQGAGVCLVILFQVYY